MRSPEEHARRAVVHARSLHSATMLAMADIIERIRNVLGEGEFLVLWEALVERLNRELDTMQQYVRDVRADLDGARVRLEQHAGHEQARAAYGKLQQHFAELAQMYISALLLYDRLLRALQAPRAVLTT